MLTGFLPKPGASGRFSLILVTLIVSAWGLLIAWQYSPYAGLLGHEMLSDHHIPFMAHLAAFLLSWFLMIVAMMLPVNLQVIINTQRERLRSSQTALLVVLGYLTPWVLFGLLAFLSDKILHETTEHGGQLEVASSYIAPSIILASGIYQLTPFKRSFIERCRPSNHLGNSSHRERTGNGLYHGLWLGINCLGSCWSLMLLMFALGHHRLDWMLILGGIAAAERLTTWGHRLVWMVGLTLIVWAVGSVIAGI